MEAAISTIDHDFLEEISVLLKPPSPLHVQEYFDDLVSERRCRVKVKPDGQHGKGVFSEVGFEEGDLILKDQMLVGSQHSSNKIDCLVCSFCFQFIGSIELQIGRKLYFHDIGVSAVDECGSLNGAGCSTSDSNEKIPLPRDVIDSLMNCGLQLPYSTEFPLPSVVPCLGGCKEAYYCSKFCAEADWHSFHSLLCIGNGSSTSNLEALLKFIKHANETNDIFICAAKAISFAILRYRKLKAALVEQKEKHDSPNLQKHTLPLLVEAWKPVSMGFKRRWWDCIALPADVDSCDEAEFRTQVKDLASESLQLLKEAIYEKECAPLFSLEIYGHIIGMFELNNLDLIVASPVEDYFLYIDDLPSSQKREAERITKPFLNALGDDYAISCEGTAFFPLQSCINHSCIPNAKAFKRDEDRDGQATIVALRPICKGEEVTISYIDEDVPYKERHELLADYGFRCKCPRCLEEEPQVG
ncbi:histone-lysine N-methyltransferase ATXR2 isoform X2 [Primulina eburnea]|uniref:histone-lysine N-methyltransferase ATXR2 isoform X2 n=1 Tax=Primulina eburnea TaxID=1245227 RepID=UPI003C6CB67B